MAFQEGSRQWPSSLWSLDDALGGPSCLPGVGFPSTLPLPGLTKTFVSDLESCLKCTSSIFKQVEGPRGIKHPEEFS